MQPLMPIAFFSILDRSNAMSKLIHSAKQFLNNENGVTSIEYALIASLIAIVIVAAVTLLGTNLNTLFTAVAAAF